MNTADSFNTIASYLARRDIKTLSSETITEPVDVLVLLGCSLTEPIHIAANAMKQGLAKRLLISGGIGHSTPYLYETLAKHPIYKDIATEGRAEADIFFDIVTKYLGVPTDSILVENKSTTCGFNAEASRALLDEQRISAKSLLLIQDPTMQQRSHACFVRNWSDKPQTQILSFAPFVPKVVEHGNSYELTDATDGLWSFERFASLVLGEIPRLRDDARGYGPRGKNFIDHVDVSDDVLTAFNELLGRFPELMRG